MPDRELYPLRVTEITAAELVEWRTGDIFPSDACAGWQLVYVRCGLVEEQCDNRRVNLRAGALLVHQPEERYGMRAVSELPPEVLRIEFRCDGTAMDNLRGRVFHSEPREQLALGWVCSMVPTVFAAPTAPGAFPQRRPDPPFGANQQLTVYLENFLIYLVRRVVQPHKVSPRVRREREQTAVVEAVRLYFADHIEENVSVQQLCEDTGFSKYQLNKAFAARVHHSPLEEFASLKLAYAAQLLARGIPPGEVTKRLGYCSGAHFSKRFHDQMGVTPSAYRRLQLGLPATRTPPRAVPPPDASPAPDKDVQQKSKVVTETSIPETADKG